MESSRSQTDAEAPDQFRAIVENSPYAIYLRTGKEFAYLNAAAVKLFGAKSAEELLGRPIMDRVHPDHRDIVRERMKFLDSQEHSVPTLEIEYLRMDGTPVAAEVAAAPFVYKGRKGAIVFSLDITDRKLAENRLKESEEKYRVFFEESPQGILAVDIETKRFIYANLAVCRMFGYTAAELLQLGIADVHPKDSLIDVMSEFESHVRQERNRAHALPCMRKDGTIFYVDLAGANTVIAGKKCAIGFMTDVSDRLNAEAKALEYESIVNRSRSIAFRWKADAGYPVEFVSENVALLGYTPEDFIDGRVKWVAITHPDDAERLEKELAEHSADGVDEFPCEYRLFDKGGRLRWVEDRTRAIRDAHGKITHYESILWDITDHKMAEQALCDSERRYHSLFENMLEGFAYCKMLFNDQGRPDDFIYLDVNKSCERLTGLKNVTGRRVTEVIPGIRESNPELFEIYGRVALTGEPEKIETNIKPLGLWLSITLYSPEKDYFIAIFDNVTERRRAEQALKESEERFRTASHMSNDVIYELNLETGQVMIFGDAWKNIGYTPEELEFSYDAWTKLIYSDDRDTILAAADLHFKSGAPFREEYRIMCKDGSTIYVLHHGNVIRDEVGKILRWVGTFTDITERKLAEDQLRESEERYRNLVERIPAITYIVSIDGGEKFLFISPQIEELLGFTPDEWIQDPNLWNRQLYPDDQERVFLKASESRSAGKPFVGEYRMFTRAQKVKWFRDEAVIIKNNEGKPIYVQGVMFDITASKNLEETLVMARNFYLTLFEDFPAMIKRSGKDGNCDYFNRTWISFTGRQTEEELGDGWMQSVHPEDLERCTGMYSEFLEKRLPFSLEYRLRYRTGEYRWVLDMGRPYHDMEGHFAGFINAAFDLTERKQVEDALRSAKNSLEQWSQTLEERVKERTEEIRKYQERLIHQEKLAVLGQISASISHELRTPLTAIKNAAYFLREFGVAEQSPKVAQHLELIGTEVDACARVINNMLDYVRPKVPIQKEARLIEIVESSISSILLPDTVSVVKKFDPNVPAVLVDAFQIQQVCNNLLRNAVDAVKANGTITVTVGVEGSHAFIEFRDTGHGIAPENLQKIFDPLFSTTPTGAGLGLTICRQFVEAHGGAIEVASELGQGAVFKVKLPLP